MHQPRGTWARLRPRTPVIGWTLLWLLLLAVVAKRWVVPTASALWQNGSIGRVATTGHPRVITLLDGSALDLDTLRGSVVALNFWAGWCRECRADAPHWRAVTSGSDKQDDLIIVGLNMENRGAGHIVPFLTQYRLKHLQALATPAWRDHFGVSVVPTTVLLARDGTTRAIYRGAVPFQVVRSGIEKLLDEAGGIAGAQGTVAH